MLARIAAVGMAVSLAVSAQSRLSLRQAGERRGPEHVPAHLGQDVVVRGKIGGRIIVRQEAAYAGLQDESGYGLVLEAEPFAFDGLAPGDVVEARGVIAARGGLPTLRFETIQVLSREPAPAPRRIPLHELYGFRHLGTMVMTEGRVAASGDSPAGEYLLIGAADRPLRVFLPRESSRSGANLARFHTGDIVRVTGLAVQEAPAPPFNSHFEILLGDVDNVALEDGGWLVPPQWLALAFALIGGILTGWWRRERRLSEQREVLRTLNALGELVIASTSSPDILRKLNSVLARIGPVTVVRVYLYEQARGRLQPLPDLDLQEAPAIDPENPLGAESSAAALCFLNRTLLAIPDTRPSPVFNGSAKPRGSAYLFVPMFSQKELLGVLSIEFNKRVRALTYDEQAAYQHLGNQVATAVTLLEQQSMREQLFRSEKLAAVGRLISDVASELRVPLESIATLANSILLNGGDNLPDRDLRAITSESRRASELLARLVSFTRAEQAEARPVDLNALLQSLMEFREHEWDARGVDVHAALSSQPICVLGAQGQLEQVFLNLLVHAEQSANEGESRTITISTTQMARRAQVEIGFTGRLPADLKGDAITAIGLGVCRGIVQSHGGQIRLTPVSGGLRFEVELPAVAGRQMDGARRAGSLTSLVVEPQTAAQRQLLTMLSERGHRVVPVSTAAEAADLIERMRFDLVLCTATLEGVSWLSFFERVRNHVGSFVLLAEGQDGDLARAVAHGDGYLLSKPVSETELDRLLSALSVMPDRVAAAR